MRYEEREQAATIGGIPLLLLTCEGESGRRTTSLEYPGRDTPSFQDHGASAERWQITAVTVGEDYDLELQRLRALSKRMGPHIFVHPSDGEFSVNFDGSLRRGQDFVSGIGRGTVSFALVEAGGEDDQLRADISTDLALVSAAEAFGAAVATNLEDNWDVSAGGSTWDRAFADVVSAGVQASVIAGRVAAATNLPDTVAGQVLDFGDTARALTSAPASLVSSLRALAGATFDLLRLAELAEVEENGAADVVAAADRAGVLVESVSASAAWAAEKDGDATSDEQAANDGALQQAANLANLGEAAAVLASLTLDSADSAVEVLTVFAEEIDAEIAEEWTGDGLYLAAVDLKAALDAHLRALAGKLPTVTTYMPADTVPALLHAFRLYGDVAREEELVARNELANPAKVAAGRELEVLSD